MKTALCSAVAALCAATLLSSIEAEGNLLLPALLPQRPADQQISRSALIWLSPSLFLSVNTSPSFFLSFRETPLLPCPAPSVFCFSRLASRTVAPSLSVPLVCCPHHPTDRTRASWCGHPGSEPRGAHCHWRAARRDRGHGSAPRMDQEGLVSGLF